MKITWTNKALSDVERLYEFLVPKNKTIAIQTMQTLIAAPKRLLNNPRIGKKLEEFAPREVRRILVGNYEMRYEIRKTTIYILRLWHTKENR